MFALSENVEDELNRELKKKVTQTNNNHSRFTINKLLNEERDELNKQLTFLNVVSITSPLESTSDDEDKSGSITSDPESFSSDDDYFKMNENSSSLLSFIKRNTTVLSNVLSKGKVKVDEQSCRSERLFALYKLGRQKVKGIVAQTQYDIFDYLGKNLYSKFYSEVWRLFTYKKKTDDFFQPYFVSLHKFDAPYYFLSDTLFYEYIVMPEFLILWLMESNDQRYSKAEMTICKSLPYHLEILMNVSFNFCFVFLSYV